MTISCIGLNDPRPKAPKTKRPRVKRVLFCHARIDPASTSTVILIPGFKLQSEANNRENRFAKSSRVKRQKSFVALHLVKHEFPRLPVLVRITRIGKSLLDKDNAWGSAKHTIDAIAAHYGIDDGNREVVDWDVQQEKGEYGVRIEIERMPVSTGIASDGGLFK